MAHRIAFLIDGEGRIVEAHRKVDPLTYPREQLERIVRANRS
jgi:peroxiredoxin